MKFVLELDLEQVNVILRQLDHGPHGLVRPLIDQLISDVAMQQAKAKAEASEPAP